MRSRKGFSILELLVIIAISSVATLVSVPLLMGSTYDARVMEARETLKMIRDRARTVYAYTGKPPNNFQELCLSPTVVKGTYFDADDYKFNSSAKNWRATCEKVFNDKNPHLTMEVDLVDGEYSYSR